MAESGQRGGQSWDHHAVAGGIWLTKGGKAVVRKISDKLVARVANSKALKSITKLANDGKFAYLKQNFQVFRFQEGFGKSWNFCRGIFQEDEDRTCRYRFLEADWLVQSCHQRCHFGIPALSEEARGV